MRGHETIGTADDYLSEREARQLEDGLRILVRVITRAVVRERSLLEGSQYGGSPDPAMRTHQVTTVREPDEPLTLSVPAATKILRLSTASTYTAVRTGQIPSIRFGSRILIPRVALERILSG